MTQHSHTQSDITTRPHFCCCCWLYGLIYAWALPAHYYYA